MILSLFLLFTLTNSLIQADNQDVAHEFAEAELDNSTSEDWISAEETSPTDSETPTSEFDPTPMPPYPVTYTGRKVCAYFGNDVQTTIDALCFAALRDGDDDDDDDDDHDDDDDDDDDDAKILSRSRYTYELVTFEQVDTYLQKSAYDSLDIAIIGSTPNNCPVVNSNNFAKFRNLEFKGRFGGNEYLTILFDKRISTRSDLEFSKLNVVLEKATPATLADELPVAEFARLKLSESPLQGNCKVTVDNLDTDVVSLCAIESVTYTRYCDVSASEIQSLTFGSDSLTIQPPQSTASGKLVRGGNARLDFEISRRSTEFEMKVEPGVTSILSGVALDLERAVVVLGDGWSQVSNPKALTIDCDNKLSIKTASGDSAADSVVSEFSFRGSGKVDVNGKVVYSGGLPVWAIAVIAIVCILVVAGVVIAIVVWRCKRKKPAHYDDDEDPIEYAQMAKI